MTVVAVWSLACAGTRMPRPTAPVPGWRQLNAAVTAARAAADSAIPARDPRRISALFAPDAELIRGSDTVRGRAAIEEAIAPLLEGKAAIRVSAWSAGRQSCIGGVHERRGTYYVHLVIADGDHANIVRGRYALGWSVDTAGTARVQTLVIAGVAARRPRLPRCVPPFRPAFWRHRVAVHLPTPISVEGWSTVASLEDVLHARGYGSGKVGRLMGFSTGTRELRTLTAAVEASVTERIRIEVVSSIPRKSATITGWDPSDSSYIRLDYSGGFLGIALTHRWGGLRVGGGPVWGWSSWTMREWILYRNAMGEYWTEGTRGAEAWSDGQLGFMALGAYIYPVSRRVFWEAQARYRWFPTATTRGTSPYFPPAAVNHRGAAALVTIGVAF